MVDGVEVKVRFAIPESAERPDLSVHDGVMTEELPPGAVQPLLPIAVLLAVVIPPGAALLAKVVNDIVHSWKGQGVLIDASGSEPVVKPMPGTPYGTIVIVKGDKEVTRSDLPGEDVSKYVAAALGALAQGDSADDAAATADKETTKADT